jgi:hypothetical protein
MRLNLHQFADRASRLAALAMLAAGLAGCQGIAGIQPTTQVRVIDASPDAPALDVYQNASVGLYSVGFGTVSSYIPTPAGTITHAAFNAGTQQQLANVRGTFLTGNQYTVLAGNIAANLQMTVLKDQSFAAPPGRVALRFLDETTRSGAVDVYLLPPGTALTHVLPTVTGLGFGSNTGYIDVPSGTYSIVVLPAGTIPTNAISPMYTGSQTNYSGGSVRTILLIDQQPFTVPGLQIISADDYDSASN